MEISGINRLLSFARDLGVQATRSGEGVRAIRARASESEVARTERGEEGGVRVSLSSTARGIAGESPAVGAVHSQVAPVGARRDSIESTSQPMSRRETAAIEAYQRNAASLQGQRFETRA